jgi:hypothetical protein
VPDETSIDEYLTVALDAIRESAGVAFCSTSLGFGSLSLSILGRRGGFERNKEPTYNPRYIFNGCIKGRFICS